MSSDDSPRGRPATALQFHQATFDLIGKAPRPSAKARKVLEVRDTEKGQALQILIGKMFSLRLSYGSKEIPADLAKIIEAWPALPGAIRVGIVVLVQAAFA